MKAIYIINDTESLKTEFKNKNCCGKKLAILAVIWFGYGNTYLTRKSFGIVKHWVQKEFAINSNLLGYIDFAFLFPYSLGSIVFSHLADEFGAKIGLGGGLIGTSLACVLIVFCKKYWEFLVFVLMCGAFQSITWPCACAIVMAWFTKGRNTVIAVLNSSTLAGSTVSSLITVYIEMYYGWHSVFWVPFITCGITGVIIITWVSYPEDKNQKANATNEMKDKLSYTFLQVLRLPCIPELSMALFCIKAARSAVMFWLPYYLYKILSYTSSEAGLLVIAVELGGVVGSIFISILIDKFFIGRHIRVSIITSLATGIVLLGLNFSANFGKIFHICILVLFGMFLNTSDLILCGIAPSQMGKELNIVSSVTGVVNGIGSAGGIAQGLLIAYISDALGPQSFAYIISTFCLAATLLAIRIEFSRIKV